MVSGSEHYSNCTYTNIFVNNIRVQAIIYSGAPVNIISSKFVKTMGLAPNIDHQQVYGMAGLNPCISIGAYSSLPMRFGSLVLSALAVVLPN